MPLEGLRAKLHKVINGNLGRLDGVGLNRARFTFFIYTFPDRTKRDRAKSGLAHSLAESGVEHNLGFSTPSAKQLRVDARAPADPEILTAFIAAKGTSKRKVARKREEGPVERARGAEPHNARAFFETLASLKPNAFSYDEKTHHLQLHYDDNLHAIDASALARRHLKPLTEEEDVIMLHDELPQTVLVKGNSEKGNRFVQLVGTLAAQKLQRRPFTQSETTKSKITELLEHLQMARSLRPRQLKYA